VATLNVTLEALSKGLAAQPRQDQNHLLMMIASGALVLAAMFLFLVYRVVSWRVGPQSSSFQSSSKSTDAMETPKDGDGSNAAKYVEEPRAPASLQNIPRADTENHILAEDTSAEDTDGAPPQVSFAPSKAASGRPKVSFAPSDGSGSAKEPSTAESRALRTGLTMGSIVTSGGHLRDMQEVFSGASPELRQALFNRQTKMGNEAFCLECPTRAHYVFFQDARI